MISIETFERLIDGVAVSQKVIKLFGLPIYTIHLESTNYNYVGQFDANNFTNKEECKAEQLAPLYSETNIGYKNEEQENKEKKPETTDKRSYRR